MRRIRNVARRLRAPGIATTADIERLEREVQALRAEIDELRSDSARIAELYDLVFQRLRDQRD